MNMKVFWPDDLDVDIQGELYGWRLADDWIVVAGVSQSVSLFKLETSTGLTCESANKAA